MLEVLAAIAGVLAVISVPSAVALAFRLDSARQEQLAGRDLLDKQRDENERTHDELDEALARATKAEDENATLRGQLVATQAADATKAEKEAQHVSDEVRTAPDASDALDRVLAESARVPGNDAAPAGAGDGDAGKPAV